MGEIGTMVARLEEEGFDLERLIDQEFESAGFVEVCSRSTSDLKRRADSIAESQGQLKKLLETLEDQLKQLKEEESKPFEEIDDDEPPDIRPENDVILIEDEDMPMSDNLVNSVEHTSPATTTTTTSTAKDTRLSPISVKQPILPSGPLASPLLPPRQIFSSAPKTPIEISPPSNSTQQSFRLIHTPTSMIPKPLPGRMATAPVALATTSAVTVGGVDLIAVSKEAAVVTVTLPASQPAIPPQQVKTQSQTTGSVTASTAEVRSSGQPALAANTPTASPAIPSLPVPTIPTSSGAVFKAPKRPQSPPKFVERARVIGKRADDLWYPGEIFKVVTDRYNQVKFKVKFDKGTRGLLTSNHIALESYPDPSVLCVGSRIVALRPRETAEENASWRKTQEGPYGKLDVLYAGIVAEIACEENQSRFLVFFDDGFAQYLPASKLHHVYHTGEKVWDDVAEHSQEFIQEYLEEFPNRPMVKLTTNRWVKTEWRGKWLKAKVLEIDCSLAKMLFQIDNRTEWIYRGSTRLEPLYKALSDGSISSSKRKKRQRKVTDPNEAYVDYSLTKPCFGFSLYSKTDPKGKQQQQIEEKRQETQKEQLQQKEKQEERDRAYKSPSKSTATTPSTSDPGSFPPPIETPSPLNSPIISPSTPNSTDNSHSRTIAKPLPGSTPGNGSTTGNMPPPPEDKSSSSSAFGNSLQGQPASRRPARFQPMVNKAVNLQQPGGSTGIPMENGVPSPSNQGWSTGYSPPGEGMGQDHGGSFTYTSMSGISESTASIIQASTMRKRTTAGLGKMNNSNLNNVEYIDLSATTANSMLVSAPAVSFVADPKTAVKNNLKSWEAPWIRNARNNVRTGGNPDKAPVVKITNNRNRKQDVAALIQERLWLQKVIPPTVEPVREVIPLIPKPPIRGPHKCGRQCGINQRLDIRDQAGHNFFAIPLLCSWKREISRRHPRAKKEVYYRAPCNRRLKSITEVGQYLTNTNTTNVTIDQFCFDVEISCSDSPFNFASPIIPDISRGQENIPIPVVNELDNSYPPPIDYVSSRIRAEGVSINLDPGFLACCDCTDNCQDKSACSCAQLTIAASAAIDGKEDSSCGYEHRRLMDSIPTGIYECNQNCACSSQCFNRVVQNGIKLRLQVFKTKSRGWGLRTLDDIPCGTFICTYSGQIMNEDMANKEGRDYGDEYLAELDHIEVVEKIKEGYESSVSDLEDDSVIYKTLGNSSNAGSNSGDSDRGIASDMDSSDSDSTNSDESFSSSLCSSTNGQKKKNVKRKSRRINKSGATDAAYDDTKGGTVTMNDEKWCVMAAPGGLQPGSIVLRRMSSSTPPDEDKDGTITQTDEKQTKTDPNSSQISDFDFDDVSDSVYDQLKTIAKTNTIKEEPKDKTENSQSSKEPCVIDLTSDAEDESQDSPSSNPVPKREEKKGNANMFDSFILGINGDNKPKITDSKSDVNLKIERTESQAKSDVKIAETRDSKVESKEVEAPKTATEEVDCSLEELDFGIVAVEGNVQEDITGEKESVAIDDTKISEETKDVDSATKAQASLSTSETKDAECSRESSKDDAEGETAAVSCETETNSGIDSEKKEETNGEEKVQSKSTDSISDAEDAQSTSNLQENEKVESKDDDASANAQKDSSKDDDSDPGSLAGTSEADSVNNEEGSEVKENAKDSSDESGRSDQTPSPPDKARDATAEPEDGDNEGDNKGSPMEIDPSGSPPSLEKTDSYQRHTPVTSDSGDSVPPLISADDLCKIAAKLPKSDEEPPTLTKMVPEMRLSNLQDMISRLQSRGVALDAEPDDRTEEGTPPLEDMPLFPPSPCADVDSFPPSPVSIQSDSSITDSIERSSEASLEPGCPQNGPRRVRRFIVTKKGNFQANVSIPRLFRSAQQPGKRSFSPTLEESSKNTAKRPSTRNHFGEEHCYVIDAKAYGNCGRYLNHSCSPNLFVQNVFIDTHDLRFPWVAFFAQHNIPAGSELTWDYMYEVGSVQDKVLRCFCGSSECRGRLL